MRIFITGGCGFIGRHVVPLLSKNKHTLLLLSRKGIPSSHGPKKIRSVIGDLKNLDRIKKEIIRFDPQVCLHLAWEGIPDFSYEQCQRNLNYSADLIHMLERETACRKIIVAGSCWEYGKMFGACRESDPSLSNSYFTWAKRTLLDLGMMLAAKKEISFIWARLFYVYGPGQHQGSLIPTFAEALRNAKRPSIKTPHNANDFVYVDDVAQALARLTLKKVPTGIYNLGTGKTTPVWKVCAILEKTMGLESKNAHNLQGSPVGATTDFWADRSKTEKMLAWDPKTNIERGIRLYVKTLEAKG